MKGFDFRPKLFTMLRSYTKADLTTDLMAGIIVGIVALPLAIAFGIASGVSPEKGIITAIVAGFIISLLGGSKVQIGGPTGAFIVIIYGIIQQYGIEGLMVATMMAGVLLILLGIFKLGTVIKFIPYPIIIGFTSGIAVTIFTTQIADIFGLDFQGEKVPGDFIGKWLVYARHFDSVNWWNFLVSIISIFIIAITPKFSKKIPGSLVAIILVTVGVYLLKMYGGITCIDTIGDRFSIKAQLPDAAVPALDWEAIKNLFPVAITIAVLGAIESLLSAAVADGVIGDRHDSNTELVAQGIANFVGYRCHRTYNDQYQQRRTLAHCRYRTRHCPVADSAVPDAAGQIHSDGLSGWSTGHCIIQHERMAGVQRSVEKSEGRCSGVADYFFPDCYLRPDRSYRGGIGHRLCTVHETCHGNNPDFCHYRRN